ncbi:ribosome-inactivating protein [Xylaria grammica]|nr:ribosome-inactivating protein [Xylaria grammica]
MNIDFVEAFDVDEGEDAYRELLERIRNNLAGDRRSACLAVRYLPPQTHTPSHWFDLVLTAAGQTIRLRIRSDDLYLEAYQQGNAATGQWFEFNDAPRITAGATRLVYQGGYPQIEPVAKTGLEGRPPFLLDGPSWKMLCKGLGKGLPMNRIEHGDFLFSYK